MVLLGYFYRDSSESSSVDGWNANVASVSSTTTKRAVGTSAIKSTSSSAYNKPTPTWSGPSISGSTSVSTTNPQFHARPRPRRQASTSSVTSSTSNASHPSTPPAPATLPFLLDSTYSISSDGAIYEFNGTSHSTFDPSSSTAFHSKFSVHLQNSSHAAPPSFFVGRSTSTSTSPDLKSRGRSSSVWSSSTGGTECVRVRGRSGSKTEIGLE